MADNFETGICCIPSSLASAIENLASLLILHQGHLR